MTRTQFSTTALGLPLSLLAQAPSAAPSRLKAAFRDPARPGTVRLSLLHGDIVVKAHDSNEVMVELEQSLAGQRTRRRDGEEHDRPDKDAEGLKRIFAPSSGLVIEEENNVMHISLKSNERGSTGDLLVPAKTSLTLYTLQGDISVENVKGEIEANATHGDLRLTDVGVGGVVAHALHGELKAVLTQVNRARPLSFSSLHGKVDLTLLAATKANLAVHSMRGEIFSDFDVEMVAAPVRVEETKRGENGGKYRVSASQSVTGKLNRGGQQIALKNL